MQSGPEREGRVTGFVTSAVFDRPMAMWFGQLVAEALAMANKIASFSRPAVAMGKETVNAAYELSLQEGLR